MIRAAILALLLLAAPAAACGEGSDCTVAGRAYRIALPQGDGPFGAIMFLHGYQGRAADAIGWRELREAARAVNAALIAPQGEGGRWHLVHNPGNDVASDDREMDGLAAILADAEGRFPIDRTRVLATGFSEGAMAVWTLACRRPALFAGFVPISGTFWAPLPTDCVGTPVDLVHIHGTRDEVVPMAGRRIRATAQGDVRAALVAAHEAGGYGPASPVDAIPGLACEGSSEPGGHRLVLCLHDGGHELDPGWIAAAYRMFVR